MPPSRPTPPAASAPLGQSPPLASTASRNDSGSASKSTPNSSRRSASEKTGSRRKHKNSHLGCKVCKRRRIKCNEEFPLCSNCRRSKLHCSYQDLTKEEYEAFLISKTLNNLHKGTMINLAQPEVSSYPTGFPGLPVPPPQASSASLAQHPTPQTQLGSARQMPLYSQLPPAPFPTHTAYPAAILPTPHALSAPPAFPSYQPERGFPLPTASTYLPPLPQLGPLGPGSPTQPPHLLPVPQPLYGSALPGVQSFVPPAPFHAAPADPFRPFASLQNPDPNFRVHPGNPGSHSVSPQPISERPSGTVGTAGITEGTGTGTGTPDLLCRVCSKSRSWNGVKQCSCGSEAIKTEPLKEGGDKSAVVPATAPL